MTEIEAEDMAGVKIKVGVDIGGIVTASVKYTPEEIYRTCHKLPEFKFRKDDIMICAFQKTGTNWLYEILSMTNNRSAERVKTTKMMTMIEVIPQEEMEKLPSPRVLNCHLPFRYLPKDMKDCKTVLLLRNPKDTTVSSYHFMKGMKSMEYDGKFIDWLPVYLQGKLTYGKYADYLKEWEKALTDGVEFPLHVMFYEDLKLNGMKEMNRLLKFLDVDIDEQLKKDILEACGFEKMAVEKTLVAKDTIKAIFHPGFQFFRKGEIGDWKNWFTVAQNEMFDEVWNREMKDSKMFKFIYSNPHVKGQIDDQ